jgi:hypothetical protein
MAEDAVGAPFPGQGRAGGWVECGSGFIAVLVVAVFIVVLLTPAA